MRSAAGCLEIALVVPGDVLVMEVKCDQVPNDAPQSRVALAPLLGDGGPRAPLAHVVR